MFGVVIALSQICATVDASIVRQHSEYWRPTDEAAQLHSADHRLQGLSRVQEAQLRGSELLRGILHVEDGREAVTMAGEVLVRYVNLISPGLLDRCSLYHRTESGAPEKCWDDSMTAGPVKLGRNCPNHTGRPRGVHYIAPVAPKMNQAPLYHLEFGEGLHGDAKPLEPETDEEA